MVYTWEHHQPLTRVGGDDVQPGEEFEPTDAELRSFAASIVEVDSESTESNGESEDVTAESDDGEDTDYASMDYSELRQLAVDADTDEIDGRSSKDDIIAYFEG